MKIENDEVAIDVLWGAKAIARAANILDAKGKPDEHRVTYLLRRGLLPGDKIGHTWTSTVSRLRAHFRGRS